MKTRLQIGALSVLTLLIALIAPQPSPAYAGETVKATVQFSIYNQPCGAEGGCTNVGEWGPGEYNAQTDPAYPGWVHISNANGDAPWALRSQMTATPAATTAASTANSSHGTFSIGMGEAHEFDKGEEHWIIRLVSWDGQAPTVTENGNTIWRWKYNEAIIYPDSISISAYPRSWGGLSCHWYRYESVDYYSCYVTH